MSKTALVTGGGIRVGATISRFLAADGYKVVIHCNQSRESADLLALEIGGEVVQANLRDHNAVSQLISRAADLVGPLDLLINNASVFDYDRLGTFNTERLEKQLDVNLIAPVLLSQAFAGQNKEGVNRNIINILDQRLKKPSKHYLSYHVSKASLWAATQILALELAPDIRVNGIGPGLLVPPPGADPTWFERLVKNAPLQKQTEIEEIAQAVMFILKSQSMTGQHIVIDGGLSIT